MWDVLKIILVKRLRVKNTMMMKQSGPLLAQRAQQLRSGLVFCGGYRSCRHDLRMYNLQDITGPVFGILVTTFPRGGAMWTFFGNTEPHIPGKVAGMSWRICGVGGCIGSS